MATYKVLQDIEAEDKLLGPLTLKQFIFAAITVVFGFVQFLIISSSMPAFIKAPFVFAFLLPMAVFGFLAAPIGQDQPNDVWLLARLRFLFKPHKRIWNQDGLSELVTITAPKKEIPVYSNGLNQTEVKSRLHALANTMDSRGWAVKNVNTNLFTQPGYLTTSTTSDRLIDPMSLPQDVPINDIQAADDILDPANNPIAQHLDQLVQASTQAHKQQVLSRMKEELKPEKQAKPENYWFMNQTTPQAQAAVPQNYATFNSQQVVAPGAADALPAAQETAEEQALAQKIVAEHKQAKEHVNDHMKVLQPLHDRDGNIVQQPTPPPQQPTQTAPTIPQSQPGPGTANDSRQVTPSPAILGLAQNDDLNVATIARQAKRMSEDDGEVVISLH